MPCRIIAVNLKKLDNNLWYMTECLVSLSFFSYSVLAKAFLRHSTQNNKIVLKQMPLLTENISLVNLVGKDSWTLLQFLNVDHGFLKADPKFWLQHNR